MSASLYYRVTRVKDTSIGYLDYIIANKFFDGQKYGSIVVKPDIIPFLEGVKAGSADKSLIKDCDRLINELNKEGELELYFAS